VIVTFLIRAQLGLLELWVPRIGLVSPVVTMMTSYFLVLEVPPLLRESFNIGSFGGTPSPRVWCFGGVGATNGFVG